MSDAQQMDAPPRWKVWFLAARPKTLGAGIAPVIIGTALAAGDGAFHLVGALCALVGSVLIQIGTNYANDYSDFVKGVDTADRIGPMRATQAGLVTPSQMRRAAALAFGMAMLAGLYLVYRGGRPIVLIGVLSITCGVLYTGGPYPLGYLGLGDLFVLIFFGPVAVAGTYYVQTLALPDLAPVAAGFGPGLFSVAILTVNNLRDIEGDRRSGKKTLAVRLGRTCARAHFTAALLVGGIGIPLLLCILRGGHWFALVSAAGCLLALPALRAVWTSTDGPRLNDALAGVGKALLAYSVLFAVGWLL